MTPRPSRSTPVVTNSRANLEFDIPYVCFLL